MSSEEIVLSVKNLSKYYETYDRPGDRLMQFIFPKLDRLFGRTPKKYYREFSALNNVSFDIKKGEAVGIIGRNGSGKSTLLQIICGTLRPSGGTIDVRGRIAALLELGSGFNPEFSGRDNVYMNAAILGLSKDQVDQRFTDIAAFAEIGDFMDQPVKTYSSGMLVRLAFSVIAHVDADILVVDEALSVGDAFFNQKCMRFIRHFQSSGGTLLFVSHDTGAVVNLCSKAILLNRGQVLEAGSPKEVSEHYLVTLYQANQIVTGPVTGNYNTSHNQKQSAPEERDMREALFNSSVLRNDIEIFRFNSDLAGFGTGDAKIQCVRLLDHDGVSLSWVVGGEMVILEIECIAYKNMVRPIVGFQFKDRLGQIIFSDNTYLQYQNEFINVKKGCKLLAQFEFRMPVLPCGDYSISPAIAEGTQEEHIQHDWLHDAMILRVQSSSTCLGLIGVPMKNIFLKVQ